MKEAFSLLVPALLQATSPDVIIALVVVFGVYALLKICLAVITKL